MDKKSSLLLEFSSHDGSVLDLTALGAALFGLSIGLLFLGVSIYISSHKAFWLDEVLAVRTSHLRTISDIFHAIWIGIEYSPPTYEVLLHFIALMIPAEHTPLALVAFRLPSILAVLGCGLLTYRLARTRMTRAASLLGAAFILSGSLLTFAIQARQYAILAFLLSLSLLIWDSMAALRHRWLRAAGIWLCLALCLSLHVYGIIDVIVVFLCETAWLIRRRTFRTQVYVAMACLIPVELGWLPLIEHLSAMNATDAAGAHFALIPALGNLIVTLSVIEINGGPGVFIFGFAALILTIYYAYHFLRGGQPSAAPVVARPSSGADGSLDRLVIITTTLLLIPLMGYGLALLATHAFHPRYMSAAALGVGSLTSLVINRFRQGPLFAIFIVIACCFNLMSNCIRDVQMPFEDLEIRISPFVAGDSEPIVIGDGYSYSQIEYGASDTIRPRIDFLYSTKNDQGVESTDDRIVRRLASLFEDVKAYDLDAFARTHAKFYLVTRLDHDANSTFSVLLRRCMLGRVITQTNETILFEAGSAVAPMACPSRVPTL